MEDYEILTENRSLFWLLSENRSPFLIIDELV